MTSYLIQSPSPQTWYDGELNAKWFVEQWLQTRALSDAELYHEPVGSRVWSRWLWCRLRPRWSPRWARCWRGRRWPPDAASTGRGSTPTTSRVTLLGYNTKSTLELGVGRSLHSFTHTFGKCLRCSFWNLFQQLVDKILSTVAQIVPKRHDP